MLRERITSHGCIPHDLQPFFVFAAINRFSTRVVLLGLDVGFPDQLLVATFLPVGICRHETDQGNYKKKSHRPAQVFDRRKSG